MQTCHCIHATAIYILVHMRKAVLDHLVMYVRLKPCGVMCFLVKMKLTNRINLPSPRRSKMAVYPTDVNAGGIAFTL